MSDIERAIEQLKETKEYETVEACNIGLDEAIGIVKQVAAEEALMQSLKARIEKYKEERWRSNEK